MKERKHISPILSLSDIATLSATVVCASPRYLNIYLGTPQRRALAEVRGSLAHTNTQRT